MRYKSASFVMGNLDILVVLVDLGLPSFQVFFFFQNTKCFNSHGEGKEDLKETDSGVYPKGPHSGNFSSFTGNIYIYFFFYNHFRLFGRYFDQFRGVYFGHFQWIKGILKVWGHLDHFTRVFWSFQQFQWYLGNLVSLVYFGHFSNLGIF